MKQMIKVENLCAGYQVDKKHLNVLNEVSFNVQAGELVCLMGPNGSGKSTLLRSISGLQKFKKGEVYFSGLSLQDLSVNNLSRKLSIVLTEQIVAPHMTVRNLIAMGRYPHLSWLLKFNPIDLELIDLTSKSCGVFHLLDKNVHELSDGQRQKVLIARALAQEGDILILDEPTSHLDLNNRVEIINLLKRLSREQDKAIVMATHELDLALQMADRLLLLNNSGELFEGIPEDLVLNGKLDEVFAFKGYDLKTGKVEHHSTGRSINLKGKGYVYLWTKNALEREGYEVSDQPQDVIKIESNERNKWLYNETTFYSINDLLQYIKTVPVK